MHRTADFQSVSISHRLVQATRGVWVLIACVTLLAGCAIRPESASVAPAQSDEATGPPAERTSATPQQPADSEATAGQPPRSQEQSTASVATEQGTPPAAAADRLASKSVQAQAPAAPGDEADREREKPRTAAEGKKSPVAVQMKGPSGVNRTPGRPTAASAAKRDSGCGKSSRGTPKPSPTGPHPRFVCKQQEITADPVWRGEKVTFTFQVANEGEADLQIKIKGS